MWLTEIYKMNALEELYKKWALIDAIPKKYVNLFILIDGIKPFKLRLQERTKVDHYIEIAEEYYQTVISKDSLFKDTDLVLHRCVQFKNGDVFLGFKRKIKHHKWRIFKNNK